MAYTAGQRGHLQRHDEIDALVTTGRLGEDQMNAAYVIFLNHDGTPVSAPKVVAITLTEDGTDIDDIRVYDSISEVGS